MKPSELHILIFTIAGLLISEVARAALCHAWDGPRWRLGRLVSTQPQDTLVSQQRVCVLDLSTSVRPSTSAVPQSCTNRELIFTRSMTLSI